MRIRALLFIVTTLMALHALPAQAFTSLFGGAASVDLKDGQVTLSAADLKPGQAKHYEVKDNGATIRFFVVRDQQGVVRAALDACEVCWHAGKGYKLRNDAMLCVNCGQTFALSRIGQVRGGCNPHPLDFALHNDTVSIKQEALAEGVRYFPGNTSGGAR